MTDQILHTFLEQQLKEGLELAGASDLFDLIPLGDIPPRKYLVHLRCTGLVKTADGSIVEADDFTVGIWFRDDHLRAVDPGLLVTVLEPRNIFHPNVHAPFVCLGHVGVGMRLVEIIYQLHALITYDKAAFHDALNGAAAAWAREHQHLFPVDHRPLRRRASGAPSVSAGVAPADDFDFAIVETVA